MTSITDEFDHLESPNPENFEALVKQLQDKIKSKMDVAKSFAAFISLVLGIVLRDYGTLLAESSYFAHNIALLGYFMLLVSLSASIATLFAYDRLLMPAKLWYIRPDTNSYENNLENLKNDMINAWKFFFIPSVMALFVGLICLLVVVTKVGIWETILFLVACFVPLLMYMIVPIKSNIFKKIRT